MNRRRKALNRSLPKKGAFSTKNKTQSIGTERGSKVSSEPPILGDNPHQGPMIQIGFDQCIASEIENALTSPTESLAHFLKIEQSVGATPKLQRNQRSQSLPAHLAASSGVPLPAAVNIREHERAGQPTRTNDISSKREPVYVGSTQETPQTVLEQTAVHSRRQIVLRSLWSPKSVKTKKTEYKRSSGGLYRRLPTVKRAVDQYDPSVATKTETKVASARSKSKMLADDDVEDGDREKNTANVSSQQHQARTEDQAGQNTERFDVGHVALMAKDGDRKEAESRDDGEGQYKTQGSQDPKAILQKVPLHRTQRRKDSMYQGHGVVGHAKRLRIARMKMMKKNKSKTKKRARRSSKSSKVPATDRDGPEMTFGKRIVSAMGESAGVQSTALRRDSRSATLSVSGEGNPAKRRKMRKDSPSSVRRGTYFGTFLQQSVLDAAAANKHLHMFTHAKVQKSGHGMVETDAEERKGEEAQDTRHDTPKQVTKTAEQSTKRVGLGYADIDAMRSAASKAVFADSRVRLTASQSSSKGQVGTALDVSLRLERWRALRGGLEKLSSQSSFYGDAVNVAQMEAAITTKRLRIAFRAWNRETDAIANERALVTVFRRERLRRRMPRILREWRLLRVAIAFHRSRTLRRVFRVLKRSFVESKEDISLRMAAESYFILRAQLYAVKQWRVNSVSRSLRRKQNAIARRSFERRFKRKVLRTWKAHTKDAITDRLIVELSDGHYMRHTLQAFFSRWQQRTLQSLALRDAGALGRAKNLARAIKTWRSFAVLSSWSRKANAKSVLHREIHTARRAFLYWKSRCTLKRSVLEFMYWKSCNVKGHFLGLWRGVAHQIAQERVATFHYTKKLFLSWLSNATHRRALRSVIFTSWQSLAHARRKVRARKASSLTKTLTTRRARRALKTWVAWSRQRLVAAVHEEAGVLALAPGGRSDVTAGHVALAATDLEQSERDLPAVSAEQVVSAGLKLAACHSRAMVLRRTLTLWRAMVAAVHEEAAVLAAAKRWHSRRVMYSAWRRWAEEMYSTTTHSRNMEVAKEYHTLFQQHRAFHGWLNVVGEDRKEMNIASAGRELLATRRYFNP